MLHASTTCSTAAGSSQTVATTATPTLSAASSLPQDILLNINNYLCEEDCYACLFVCRQWYLSFIAKFYTSVTIRTANQCAHLCGVLDAIAQSQGKEEQQELLQLGHAVKELHMDLGTEVLEKPSSSRLPGHLPFLKSFTVSSFHHQSNHHGNNNTTSCDHGNHSITLPKSADNHITNDNDTDNLIVTTAPALSCGKLAPSRSFLGTSIDTFWTLPTTLTQLHLSIPRLQKGAILRLLRKVPRLTSMYLNWINGSWTCSYMDAVHQLCPDLQHVWVFAETFHTESQARERQREPNAAIDDDEEDQDLWDRPDMTPDEIINRLFPPPSPLQATTTTAKFTSSGSVAKKLTHFYLSIYRGLPEHMSDWFVYAARNYPNLESFSLETRPKHLDRVGERAFEYDLLDMLMTYKWASRTWKQAEVPAFGLFVRSCPKVQTVNLFQLYLTRHLLSTIFACGLPIQHFGTTRNIHSIWTAENNWCFSESLVSLSLQACVTPPANNDSFMKFLGSLIHLKHLNLARYEHFTLFSLLEACPGLETLTLEHMAITYNSNVASNNTEGGGDINGGASLLLHIQRRLQQRALEATCLSLRQLTIRQTVLKESFFGDIPSSLEDLVVEDSAIIGTEPYRASILMPSLSLQTLVMNHMLFEGQHSVRKIFKQSGQQFSAIGLVQCYNKPAATKEGRSNAFLGATSRRWYDFRRTNEPSSSTNSRQPQQRNRDDERVLGIRPMADDFAEDLLDSEEVEGIYSLEISCQSIKRACINNSRLLDPQLP
ncbi:hypothetical protein BDB00DRAFT_941602 [Zychaea mexicana]|uniref:uncharacterized protein n=1 Tax=Zychaea mexicana TaxID=64656 RepID=UPI0022FED3BC|nr:uncharacterized protein BDB00DRAFT_941602 [Zychaea mexicana]KAI9489450.1 hypothetical protein BDB00DRAFT_941602 [Zychaea mexicana]